MNCANGKSVCIYPNCGRIFKTKFSLKRHMVTHTGERNFKCKGCGKRFALYQYLKEHTLIHSDELPYVCGINGCQQRFRQAGKLSFHRRTHKEYRKKQYSPRSKDFYKRIENRELTDNNCAKQENIIYHEMNREDIKEGHKNSIDFLNPKENINKKFEIMKKSKELDRTNDSMNLINNFMSILEAETDIGIVYIHFLKIISTPLTLILKPKLPFPNKKKFVVINQEESQLIKRED